MPAPISQDVVASLRHKSNQMNGFHLRLLLLSLCVQLIHYLSFVSHFFFVPVKRCAYLFKKYNADSREIVISSAGPFFVCEYVEKVDRTRKPSANMNT